MDDFCQYRLFRKRPPNFFIPPPYVRASEGKNWRPKNPSLQIKSSDPSKLLLLIASLKSNSSKALEKKINQYLLYELNCQACFIATFNLILPNEAVIRVINHFGNNFEINFSISIKNELINQILKQEHGLTFVIEILWPELLEKLKEKMPHLRGEVLSFPIFHEGSHEAAFVAFIVGPNNQSRIFISNLVQETFRFSFSILFNAIKSEESERRQKQADNLLKVVENFNSKIDQLDLLVQDIFNILKILTESEWGCIYLWKQEDQMLVPVVHDVTRGKLETLSKNMKIPGFVFTTGKKLVIKKAHEHRLFLKTDDLKYDMVTRNIFCFPINDLGVVYLCNKIGDKDYNTYDEEKIADITFSCYLAINHALELQGVKSELLRSKNLQKLKFEVRESDIKHLLQARKPDYENFYDLTFNPRDVPGHLVNIMILKIFEDFHLIEIFKFDKKMLATFILQLEGNYSRDGFHNWMHAFTTIHFVASILKGFNVPQKTLSDLDNLALFIACLGYDVGTNGMCNVYKIPEDDNLVYKAAIVEKYNMQKTLQILTNDACNFLIKLDDKSYMKCLELIKSNILATSAEKQRKILRKQEILLQNNFKANSETRFLFTSLLISCAEFSDQIKSWKNTRTICSLLYDEYLINNNKVVDEQIYFLKTTCLPLFTVLKTVYPDLQFCVDIILTNIRKWDYSRKIFMDQEIKSKQVFENELLSITDSLLEEEVEEEEEENISLNIF